MDDSLQMDLEDWDDATLHALVGRSETQRLEFKGQLDPSRKEHRRKLAEAVACMTSASGGFIIVGTNDDDVLTALPGVEIDETGVDRFRHAIHDLVRPYALIKGPRLFGGDTPDRATLVIEVFPNPLGLPASVDGRFLQRVERDCKPMPYAEVQRRLRTEMDLREVALSRLQELIPSVRSRLSIDHPYKPPMTVAVTPLATLPDLGLVGNDLRTAFAELVDFEEEPWRELDRGYWGPGETPLEMRSFGVRSEVSHYWSWLITHDGTFVGAVDLIGAAAGSGVELGHIELVHVTQVITRIVAYGLALQGRLGIAGPSLIDLYSGPIAALRFGRGMVRTSPIQEPPERVEYAFITAPGRGALDTVRSNLRIFFQRLLDGTGRGEVYQLDDALDLYLQKVLSWDP